MVLPDERQQKRVIVPKHVEANPAVAGKPVETVIGWPSTLRLPHDPEGRVEQGPHSGVFSLLTLAMPALGASALTVRFRSANGIEVVACPSEAAGLFQADPGPLAECELHGLTIEVGDLSAETRWPSFTAAALAAGLRSVIVVPLYIDSTVGPSCIGSVSCFHTDARELSALLATAKLEAVSAHLSVLIANAENFAARSGTIVQLREAMLSRSVIEQAKGVLMAREKIDAETAWEYLVRISQRTHRKLRDISTDIVAKASAGAL